MFAKKQQQTHHMEYKIHEAEYTANPFLGEKQAFLRQSYPMKLSVHIDPHLPSTLYVLRYK